MRSSDLVAAALKAVDPSGRRPQAVLARRMGVERQAVSRWAAQGYFPAYLSFDVQAATGGKVSARAICQAEKERRADNRKALEVRRYGTD